MGGVVNTVPVASARPVLGPAYHLMVAPALAVAVKVVVPVPQRVFPDVVEIIPGVQGVEKVATGVHKLLPAAPPQADLTYTE